MKKIFKNLFKLLDITGQKKIFPLFILASFFLSCFEILSLGTLIPLIDIVINKSTKYQYIYDYFSSENKFSELEFFGIIFILIFILKNFFTLCLNFFNFRLITSFQEKVANKLFQKYLSLNFIDFVKRKPSSFQKNLTIEVLQTGPFISQSLIVTAETLVLMGLTSFMILMNQDISLLVICLFFISVSFYYKISKKLSRKWGFERRESDQLRTGTIINSFFLFKELKIKKIKDFFIKKFYKYNSKRNSTELKELFLSSIPRIYLELIFVSFIILLVIFFYNNNSNNNFKELSVYLALFAVYSIRIIPSINKIMYGVQSLNFRLAATDLIINEINSTKTISETEKLKKANNLEFNSSINFKNVSFSYNKNLKIFSNLNLKIKKNSFVGIVGDSGSGKSTFLSLFTGYLFPDSGEISIDDKFSIKDNFEEWIEKISFVYQDNFIIDDTLANNIALGSEKEVINYKKLNQVIEIAQLSSFVKNLSQGLNTYLGDSGLELSGGQKQRVAIARAFYKNSEIIILDEPTSSLDPKNEDNFLKFINSIKNKITIIFVTHKNDLLKEADIIYKLDNQSLNVK